MIIKAVKVRMQYENEGWTDYWKDIQEAGKMFYDLKYMYDEAMYARVDYLSRALDSGEEADVKAALCRYIEEKPDNPILKAYVNSVQWLVPRTGENALPHIVMYKLKGRAKFQSYSGLISKPTIRKYAVKFTKGEAVLRSRELMRDSAIAAVKVERA